MGEIKTALLILLGLASVGIIIWLAGKLGDRIINKFFKNATDLEELKASMMTEKLNRIVSQMGDLSNALKAHGEESNRTKIMMQSLNHQIDSFRSELKSSDLIAKKTSEYLIAILKSMQEEIESHGRIIMRMPEGK